MEENINEILGVNQEPTTKDEQTKEEVTIDNSAENTLCTLATIILVCGIIATVFCLFYLTFYRVTSYGSVRHDEFNPSGFATTLEILAGTLVTWASLRVFANISKTLKEINSKIK